MIITVVSDVLQSPAQVLVNAVNTVGVMGKGIAHDFKLCYPDMFARYRDLCQGGNFDTGRLMLYRTSHKWVLNFPTKTHWRANTRLDDLRAGLERFAATYAELGITSVSFPRLAGDSDGLDWQHDVKPLMEHLLDPLPLPVYVHEYDPDDPYLAAESRNIRSVRAWLEGDPQPVAFARFWRDVSRLLRNNERQFTTVDGEAFTIGRDKRRRGRSLVILGANPQPVFLSESVLADLWGYVRSAGYAHPRNFPGGLDAYAPYITGLLRELDYVRPVHLLEGDGTRQTGLHYVPPTSRNAADRPGMAWQAL